MTIGILTSITLLNVPALLAVALMVRRDFESTGRLHVTTAICLGIVFYIPVVVTLLTAWSGIDRGSLALPTRWALSIGLVCMIPGIALIAAGRITFGSRARTFGLREDELFTRGIYAWSRNPQYFGTILVLAGVAIIGTSASALTFAGLFSGLMHIYVIKIEEPHLTRAFPSHYAKYCRTTNRYFGRSKSRGDELPG